MRDFEKLGLFYLGREYDPGSRTRLDAPILYDSRDLVTHAVCVGMTGSGKTGLCLSLIEEAAIDGIPVIAIDPKGDLGNLLLTFPHLSADEFRPWVDEDEARRAGLTPDAFAGQQAAAWARGLADWGQDGARIDRLRAAADFSIYTPGSRAGTPVSVLSSFEPPPAPVLGDAELLGERASSTATSLLTLAGAEAQPRSREHTLVTTLLTAAWVENRGLDLAGLIHEVQTPPFQRVGVVDLEAFFPAKDRFALAMQFNGVLAAPGFDLWFEGAPLDPSTILYTADGRPRVAIFSISHLAEPERMFFVTLLLNQILGWMRSQTGTSSLRALVYMDEIAGYFPPVANPPSKAPLLTLLKQGRAFGLGVVLATQNPVDLDYKGLSNTGTWFLGRLQTEQDKARVLDGLEGAAAGTIDRAEADRLLSGLDKRVFLLHNVHDKAPVVFQTRWTLSYLRGPLSRDHIRALTKAPASPVVLPAGAPVGAAAGRSVAEAVRPVLPPGITQYFLPSATGEPAVYTPVILGAARVSFSDARLGVEASRDVIWAAPIGDGALPVDWAAASPLDMALDALHSVPEDGASFLPLPAAAAQPRNYPVWLKALAARLVQSERIELLRHPGSKLTSRQEESERDFRIRVQEALRSARDEALDAMRRKYAVKQAALAERLRRADAVVGRESEQASQQKLQTAVSFGATVLGALFGRKAISAGSVGRATTAARGVGRSMKEASDVKRAAGNVEAIKAQMTALDAEAASQAEAIASGFETDLVFERVSVAPRRGQVSVQVVGLGWDPR